MKTTTINRTGRVHYADAYLSIWEEGISTRCWDTTQAWEQQFKHDVFKRIVQTLRRLGWTVGPQHYISTDNNNRFCQKGDLKGDLQLSGRSIAFQMFQSVNCPTRADHEGRYESNKTALMPYLMRLELQRTRDRIRDYLCNVFDGYTFNPPKISSPNPDPLAYFNDSWDSQYDKARGKHRFNRGPDGWPDAKEVGSWDRKDSDGTLLDHGDVRWLRARDGRLQRGRVYGGINGMWMFVYGPGQRDHTSESAKAFFTYRPGETPAKLIDLKRRRARLEAEMVTATKAMSFERAAVLRDVLFPKDAQLFHIRHRASGTLFGPSYSGYTNDPTTAGRYTRDELKPYLKGALETEDFLAVPIGAPA